MPACQYVNWRFSKLSKKTELQRKPRRTADGWRMRAHLSLQLSHSGCEVEHQPGDVLQLVLQDMDGICLLLVLEMLKHTLWSATTH